MEAPLVVSLCLPLEDQASSAIPVGADVEDLLSRALELGVFPVVFNNLRTLGLLDPLGPHSAWLDRFRQSYAHNLAIQREEAGLVERLAHAGLSCCAIKGVRLAVLLYPDLSWRGVFDIDLLAPRDRVAEVYSKLKEFGLRDVAEPWNQEALSRQIAQPVHAFPEVLLVGQHKLLVELHWDWVAERFPKENPAEDPEAYLVYLCRHAAKHFWCSLQWVCDIELYLRKFGPRLDWNRFWELAKGVEAERSCAATFHLCSRLFERPLCPQETAVAARAGRALSRQAAKQLFCRTKPKWWEHNAWNLLRIYNWRQRINRFWKWLAPPPWHWRTQATHRSSASIWLERYRRLLFQAAGRLAPTPVWKGRFRKAEELSLRDWGTLAEAGLTLAAVQSALRVVSFRRLERWIAPKKRSAASQEQTREIVHRKAWLVEVAANHHLVPMRCLPRSATLVWMLARRGIETELKLGVRQAEGKFQAHAWVEWQGEPLGDPGQPQELYVPLEPVVRG